MTKEEKLSLISSAVDVIDKVEDIAKNANIGSLSSVYYYDGMPFVTIHLYLKGGKSETFYKVSKGTSSNPLTKEWLDEQDKNVDAVVELAKTAMDEIASLQDKLNERVSALQEELRKKCEEVCKAK